MRKIFLPAGFALITALAVSRVRAAELLIGAATANVTPDMPSRKKA
jgi:hypothetical protein